VRYQYEEYPSHAIMYLDPDSNDEDAVNDDDSYALELFGTKELTEDLLGFINQQLEVMRVLKIHHMSQLSKPMQDLKKGLEYIAAQRKREEVEITF
jgi:hypothetical protein